MPSEWSEERAGKEGEGFLPLCLGGMEECVVLTINEICTAGREGTRERSPGEDPA